MATFEGHEFVAHFSGLMKCALVVLLSGLMLIGCARSDRPFREASLTKCDVGDCNTTYVEKHDKFDLAYVEFTERGNAFNRNKMQEVLKYVEKESLFKPDAPGKGVTVVVFVHGWKHNARAADTNVESFRDLLRVASEVAEGPRRMIGIYVGWRGLSIKVWGIKELSYWDRKAVAEQVGKGGVTELLLRLEQIVIDDKRPNRNLFLVTGHSFGGAIVLSGLNEVLLERVVNAQPPPESGGECLVTRPFGHGVVLLNPAIEANEALQLKEHVIEVASKTPFCKQQDRLMHVISSRADTATELFFVLGQSLGVNPTWRQTKLRRTLACAPWEFEESDLDTTTVGNFKPFQTGELLEPQQGSKNAEQKWGYKSFVTDDRSCKSDPEKPAKRLRVTHNEPLAFIRTDAEFIGDHNDVFSPEVASYLAAIVAEARYKRTLGRAVDGADDLPKRCRGEEPDFNFGSCFKAYQAKFKEAWPR